LCQELEVRRKEEAMQWLFSIPNKQSAMQKEDEENCREKEWQSIRAPVRGNVLDEIYA
jgi:hypothetical protein